MFKIFTKRHRFIKKAMQCKGWTSYGKLEQLYDLMQSVENVEGDILEIGSAWGRSAVLLLFASQKKMYSIDPHTGGRAFIEKNENQDSLTEFRANIAKFGFTDRVQSLVHTTAEVHEQQLIKDHKFAFIFIDGLHTPEGVKIDFDVTYPLLAKGGIMAFDDYYASGISDYTAMLDQLFEEYGVEVVRNPETKLVYFKK